MENVQECFRDVPNISKIEYEFCAPYLSRYYNATDKAKENVLKDFVVAMRKKDVGLTSVIIPDMVAKIGIGVNCAPYKKFLHGMCKKCTAQEIPTDSHGGDSPAFSPVSKNYQHLSEL